MRSMNGIGEASADAGVRLVDRGRASEGEQSEKMRSWRKRDMASEASTVAQVSTTSHTSDEHGR